MRLIFPFASAAWQVPHLDTVKGAVTGKPASAGSFDGVVTLTSGVDAVSWAPAEKAKQESEARKQLPNAMLRKRKRCVWPAIWANPSRKLISACQIVRHGHKGVWHTYLCDAEIRNHGIFFYGEEKSAGLRQGG